MFLIHQIQAISFENFKQYLSALSQVWYTFAVINLCSIALYNLRSFLLPILVLFGPRFSSYTIISRKRWFTSRKAPFVTPMTNSIPYCMFTNASLRKVKRKLKVQYLPCLPRATNKMFKLIYLRSREALGTACYSIWRSSSKLVRILNVTIGYIELVSNSLIGRLSLMEGENLISMRYL